MSRLPSDWVEVRLDHVADVSNGMTPSRGEPRYWTDGIYPWLPTGKVHERFIRSADEFISQAALDECSIRVFPAGSVLVGMIGQGVTRGMTAYLAIDAAINQNFACIMPHELLDGLFVFYYIDGQYKKLRNISQGSNQGSLNCEIVGSFKIPLPPLPEQRKIAQILSTWDEAIQVVEALIAALKARKRGLMQRLLTGEVRFPGFDGEWEEVRLIDLARDERYSFTGGPFGSNLKAEDYTENGVRIIQLQNIGDGEFLNEDKIYTSKEKADELYSCNIFPGDIILSKMGDPVARAAIVPNIEKRYVMASDGIRLAIDRGKYNVDFILDTINDFPFRKSAIRQANGSTRQRIGLNDLKNLKLTVPHLEEQEKIADILVANNELVLMLYTYAAALREQKKGLMQRLLTGEVRVKV